jgi:HK97 family phage major capsid protein
MADTPDLQRLLQDKHEAVRAYREATDEDVRTKAWDGVHVASEALEAALVDRETVREDEARMAAVEAREKAARIAHSTVPVTDPLDDFNAEVRDFMSGKTQKLVVPYGGRRELRTDQTTIDTTIYGKYTITNPVWQQVEWHMNAQSGILKAPPTIIRTPGFEIMYIPKALTDPAATAAAEGAAGTVRDPVMGRTTLGAQRYGDFFSVSDEMLASSDLDWAGVLGDFAGRACASIVAQDLAIAAGTGTLPMGLMAHATSTTTLGTTAASATTFTFDELIALKMAVLPGYRMSPSCAWMFSTTAYVILASMKDDEGRYLWSPSTVGNEPDRLLGNPCYEEANGDTVHTAGHPVIYGDFSHYWVRYSGPGMVFERDPSVAFTSFEQTFRYAIWVDADLGDLEAIKHLLMA